MNLSKADIRTSPDPSLQQRPRWGRRVLAALAFLALAVGGSCFIWWGTSLRRLPDIGHPFDLATYGTYDIPDADNAWTYYRKAVAMLTPSPTTPRARGRLWSLLPPQDRDWALANREALETWYVGTTKARSIYNQPKDLRLDTKLDVAQNLRTVSYLANLIASEREDAGDFDGAWKWHKAALRASRHCGMHGTVIERLIGMAMYNSTATYVRTWSDYPSVSATALRHALDDLIAINAMTPPCDEWVRSEYFVISSILDDPDLSAWSIQHQIDTNSMSSKTATAGDRPGPLERLKEAFWRVGLREPERSRRVNRLIYANWLSVGDLPDHERARRRRQIGDWTYFDPPPDAPESARLLGLEDLDRWLLSTRYIRSLLISINALEKASDREAATRASLVVHLAERLYARENGKEPPSIEALVGPYLKEIPPGYLPPEPPKPETAGAPR
jgi:hypothetical protein